MKRNRKNMKNQTVKAVEVVTVTPPIVVPTVDATPEVVTEVALTFEQVDAMTRSELIEALTAGGRDFQEVNGMTHTRMVGEFWKLDGPKVPEVAGAPATATPGKVAKVKADKGKDCACDCGGRTKGGTWLPGHDAIHNAKNALGGKKHQPRLCACDCGETTKGGQFRPGHDARYYAALHAAMKIGMKPGILPIENPTIKFDTFRAA